MTDGTTGPTAGPGGEATGPGAPAGGAVAGAAAGGAALALGGAAGAAPPLPPRICGYILHGTTPSPTRTGSPCFCCGSSRHSGAQDQSFKLL